MVDRSVIAPLEQMRDFDFVSFEHDTMVGVGGLSQDVLSGASLATVGGLAATQTAVASLTINIGPGRIYVMAAADTAPVGSIPTDATLICQQGANAGQILTFAAPSAGQSQWNLVQCQFSQADSVRANDPNQGNVPFYNAANPTIPNIDSVNTVRQGLCVLQVITGSAATTGSEIPPQPTSGWTPLYLIDLAGGQTQITTAQIRKAGPSVGTGVPSNYPGAPFLAGLLGQHHLGIPGHAPKINLVTEVQGVLPYVNMSPVRTLLSGALTLFVNGSTGNDTNAGLSPTTAFKTIQAAINTAQHNYDFNGNGCTISIANGSYTTAGPSGYIAVLNTNPLGCPGVSLVGNVASPGSVTLGGVNNSAVSVGTGGNMACSGMTVTATGTSGPIQPGNGFGFVADGGVVQVSNVVCGACQVSGLWAGFGGLLNVTGPITFTGSSGGGAIAGSGGLSSISQVTVTFTTATFTVAFAQCGGPGLIYAPTDVFVGTFTGTRYVVNTNGVIVTGGSPTYFPGSVGGSASTGGQYV